jgi:hypothetical protein
MRSLGYGDRPECGRNLRESFIFCDIREAGVEFGMLELLAVGCGFQVVLGRPDETGLVRCHNFYVTTLEEFEESLGMFFLVISGLEENPRNVFEAIFLCLGGKIRVPVSRLWLSGKCCKEVSLSFGPFKAFPGLVSVGRKCE